MSIHPSAFVDPRARIADRVEIGPFCMVGPEVEIGPDSVLRARVTLQGPLKIGRGNLFHSTVAVGGPPQDFDTAAPGGMIEIGDDNVFREGFTTHRPKVAGGPTRIGSNNHFMIGTHLGHDCVLGNHVTIAPFAVVAGHCSIDDHAWIGPVGAIHQFVTLGRYSRGASHTVVPEDVPPFMKIAGNHFEVVGVNREALARARFPEGTISALEEAHRIVWRSALPRSEAIPEIEKSPVPEVRELARFLRSSAQGRMGRAREVLRQ